MGGIALLAALVGYWVTGAVVTVMYVARVSRVREVREGERFCVLALWPAVVAVWLIEKGADIWGQL